MAIEAVAAIAAKEVAVQAAREAAMQAAREIAQKMAAETGAQGAGNELQTAMMERQTMQEGFRVGEMPETKGEGRELLKQKEADAADELRGKLDADETRPEAENAAETESSEVQNPAESEVPEADAAQEAAETQEAVETAETADAQEGAETAEQVEGQEALRDVIKEETGWSDEIVDSIRNEGEYGVYKNADLKEGTVNGKQCLQREIDPSFKDDFGRTNMERMQNGLSPYDAKSGEKLELHHMGQKADSPFAELRENIDHGDGNHHVLHEFKTESWRHEPGSEQAYASQRTEYWKTRAQQLAA